MSDITEHPPVPQLLQEKLKDYPELIAQLQETLNKVGRSPQMSKTLLTDQFESAIWRLENRLDRFASEAREELKAAEAASDPELIAKAEAKELLMHSSRSSVVRCLEELGSFFGR
ncbi:MAG: hypothetical protein CVU22_04265 [Betaproteobacteria bacterium HGW-Betaproteobacteria-16]|nr:MAG: hypothetical protein CVU22_04265 [Betaproteobacteria bacterium HGW-Betaproteobacteria-16]